MYAQSSAFTVWKLYWNRGTYIVQKQHVYPMYYTTVLDPENNCKKYPGAHLCNVYLHLPQK